MTEQQAISKIQYRIDTASEITGKGTDGNAYEDLEIAIQALSEIQQYRAIGTVEECRTAVERMKPKKPTDIVMAKDRKICVVRMGKCPCCGSIVAEGNFTCGDCFQVLDWSE